MNFATQAQRHGEGPLIDHATNWLPPQRMRVIPRARLGHLRKNTQTSPIA